MASFAVPAHGIDDFYSTWVSGCPQTTNTVSLISRARRWSNSSKASGWFSDPLRWRQSRDILQALSCIQLATQMLITKIH